MLKYFYKWWWVIPVILIDLWLLGRWTGCSPARRNRPGEGGGCARRQATEAAERLPPLLIAFPTAQTNLWRTDDSSVFMPTQSGRVQSALYGSTRTRLRDGRAIPAFHEGIDIAPMRRDAAGKALDDVFAVADGVVGYANRTAGASSYGRYVVIEHEDAVGQIYSLYSHLASVSKNMRQAAPVEQGDVLGRMGHSSTLGIPRARSHLHFEVSLMLNRRFEKWLRKHKMDTRHGIHHGWNLTGINPLVLYPTTNREQHFSMLEHLGNVPIAFELMLRTKRPLDYFERYDALWKAETEQGNVAVLSVSNGGVILAGRPPTQNERSQLGARGTLVLQVNPNVLGRNGPGLIAASGDEWKLTRKGRRRVEILLY